MGATFFGSEEEYREAVDRSQAEGDLLMHQIARVILEELTEEQCFVLSKMLKNIRDADPTSLGGTIANYWIGVLMGRLHAFGVCMACGKKHDEELREEAPA